MIPTAKDLEGLIHLEREIRRSCPPMTAHIQCFNKDEATWIRQQLEARGIAPDAFWISWMSWDHLNYARELRKRWRG